MNECATRMRHVATDACVLASNNASPAQRVPRRDAQPPHATGLARLLSRARLSLVLQALASARCDLGVW